MNSRSLCCFVLHRIISRNNPSWFYANLYLLLPPALPTLTSLHESNKLLSWPVSFLILLYTSPLKLSSLFLCNGHILIFLLGKLGYNPIKVACQGRALRSPVWWCKVPQILRFWGMVFAGENMGRRL